MSTADIVGAIGVAMLLIAFVANLKGWLRAESFQYLGLNFVGAGMACYASWMIRYWPFVVLEGVWALQAFSSLVTLARPKKGQ